MRITLRYHDSVLNQDGYLVDGVLCWVPSGLSRAQVAQNICAQIGLDSSSFLAWWNRLAALNAADTVTSAQIVTDANAVSTLAQARAVLVELTNKVAFLEALVQINAPSLS